MSKSFLRTSSPCWVESGWVVAVGTQGRELFQWRTDWMFGTGSRTVTVPPCSSDQGWRLEFLSHSYLENHSQNINLNQGLWRVISNNFKLTNPAFLDDCLQNIMNFNLIQIQRKWRNKKNVAIDNTGSWGLTLRSPWVLRPWQWVGPWSCHGDRLVW